MSQKMFFHIIQIVASSQIKVLCLNLLILLEESQRLIIGNENVSQLYASGTSVCSTNSISVHKLVGIIYLYVT